jgi:hypothetical protein
MGRSRVEKKNERIATGKKRLKKKKVDALTCPYCLRGFTGLFYLKEHWCSVLETEYKHFNSVVK